MHVRVCMYDPFWDHDAEVASDRFTIYYILGKVHVHTFKGKFISIYIMIFHVSGNSYM